MVTMVGDGVRRFLRVSKPIDSQGGYLGGECPGAMF